MAYFPAPGGVEAPFAMAASTIISFDIPCVFSFDHKPYWSGFAASESHVSPDDCFFK